MLCNKGGFHFCLCLIVSLCSSSSSTRTDFFPCPAAPLSLLHDSLSHRSGSFPSRPEPAVHPVSRATRGKFTDTVKGHFRACSVGPVRKRSPNRPTGRKSGIRRFNASALARGCLNQPPRTLRENRDILSRDDRHLSGYSS